MGWLYLFTAIIFELFGTTMMKLSNGLSVPVPTVLMFAGYLASFAVLALALKTIDVSVAYAIWCRGCADFDYRIFGFWRRVFVTEAFFNSSYYCRCCLVKIMHKLRILK